MTSKPKGIFVLGVQYYDLIYGPAEREDIGRLVDLYAPPQTPASIAEDGSVLGEAEVLLTGWGAPKLDETFLAAAPNLKAVFFGAGSIRRTVTEAFWRAGIPITGAYGANAIPVAEYTFSQIIFCLKRGWHYAMTCREQKKYAPRDPVPGAYGTTAGIISLGMIGRHVCKLLQATDVDVIAYDPYVDGQDAAELGVTLCGLEELFRTADVVSLHTPILDATRGMITGEHLASMKPDASFINTARGAVVRENEMIEVAARRGDLYFVLDVTDPEPPEPGSRLYTLPNVILTPHIAGAMSSECRRMGRFMVEELQRYLAGRPMKWAITEEQAAILA